MKQPGSSLLVCIPEVEPAFVGCSSYFRFEWLEITRDSNLTKLNL
jgi:hypothetical protein